MLLGLAAVIGALIALLAALNVGGWRARILLKLFEVNNWPKVVAPPAGFEPSVPSGFGVSILARDLEGPRWLAVSPRGDVFVAESTAGKIIVIHQSHQNSKADRRFTFAEHLHQPFGLAFHDQYLYVGDTDEVIRFRYDPGTSQRLGPEEPILRLPGGGYHQHWTRTLAFGPDGRKLFISVGSKSNASVDSDPRRATIIITDPDGRDSHVYASGLRNAVGIGFNAISGQLWATVNERDGLGDDVPSDYFTHVVEGGFYGWPYCYLGGHQDPRAWPQRPDLVAKTLVPDLLLGAHVAPLQFAFYEAHQFPAHYRHGAFIAEHGSWNRTRRAGYQVVFVPFKDGEPCAKQEIFLGGFVPDPGAKPVYGRTVGVAIGADGSLLVSDDGSNMIWRVTFEGGGGK